MKIWQLVTVLLVLAPSALSVSQDRLCGNDKNNLWLDLILIVDNSQPTDSIYETISGIFGPQSQIGTHYEDPRSSRVAIITYNNEATTVGILERFVRNKIFQIAQFSTFKSLDQLKTELTVLKNSGTSGNESYLDTGLSSAQAILNKTEDRMNYKKVVLVFASTYDLLYDRPDYIAHALKSNGVTVITVYTGNDKTVKGQLKNVASDGFAFQMSANTTTDLQNALTTVNCFCTDSWTWTQYKHFGICMLYPGVKGNQKSAHKYCKSLGLPSNLATEFNEDKRKFNYKFINSFDDDSINSYWNGLTCENSTWYWDQPKGQPLVPLDSSSGSISASTGCVADVKHSDGSVKWTPISCSNLFYFLCEAKACDTDNYCD
ncbi:hypothetical protein B9Z55_004601 [Caenorhabditis nigoni]|uniref:VWFA domain-containing protein n=1 Tax=Caenorhabditis nigoni TaxID=1611254 RepID=A0A2G5UX88_9PELO|nr:hypothetical protein B9Z55_004601 [Caenorhabditis nigoni]